MNHNDYNVSLDASTTITVRIWPEGDGYRASCPTHPEVPACGVQPTREEALDAFCTMQKDRLIALEAEPPATIEGNTFVGTLKTTE